MVLHKGSMEDTTQKTHKKVISKIIVVGKHLNLGVWEPREKPSWEKTRLSGIRGSHPGQES